MTARTDAHTAGGTGRIGMSTLNAPACADVVHGMSKTSNRKKQEVCSRSGIPGKVATCNSSFGGVRCKIGPASTTGRPPPDNLSSRRQQQPDERNTRRGPRRCRCRHQSRANANLAPKPLPPPRSTAALILHRRPALKRINRPDGGSSAWASIRQGCRRSTGH